MIVTIRSMILCRRAALVSQYSVVRKKLRARCAQVQLGEAPTPPGFELSFSPRSSTARFHGVNRRVENFISSPTTNLVGRLPRGADSGTRM
jgi:hypothetical protein